MRTSWLKLAKDTSAVSIDWLQSPVTKYFFLIICLIIH